MAYRGKYNRTSRRRGCLAFAVILPVLVVLLVVCAVLYRGTAGNEAGVTDNSGLQEQSIPANPYKPEDYVEQDGLITCLASPVSLLGVDVSSYQGEIDWPQVAGAGIRFAIIRAGYRGYETGVMHADERFEENIQGALAAGLDVGAYFYSQAVSEDEAREEARMVLEMLEGYEVTYPVVFDWEENGATARTAGVDNATLTSCALAFCEEISAAGYEAGFYFNQSFGYQRFNLKALEEYSFWLAEYGEYQSFMFEVDLWQYTSHGSVPGIGTRVDLDLSYRDYGSEPAAAP